MILNNNPEEFKGHEAVIAAAVEVARHHGLKDQEPQAGLVLSLGAIEIASPQKAEPQAAAPAPKGQRYDM